MKILILEGDIRNAMIGFRKNLVDELRKEHDVYIAGSIAYSMQTIDSMSLNKKTIVLGKLYNNPIKSVFYLLKLIFWLYKINPDLCLSFNLRPNLFIGLASFFKKVNLIATVTGTGFLFDSDHLKLRVLRYIYKISLRRCIAVFIQNQSDCDQFISSRFTFKRYFLIPGSGVDIEKFKPLNSQFTDRGEANFIFIARLIREKGFFEYIEAAKQIKRDYNNVSFFVMGSFYKSGASKSYIDESIVEKLHNEGIIIYLGQNDNIIPIVEKMDCIVLPSYREGVSNTLMEGAALAKPLIATNVPGCKELIDHEVNGFICNPKDSIDLEAKMKSFIELDKKQRQEMGILARKKVVGSFNRDFVIKEYQKVITSLK
jgi:glycosyltransferase involved in cell wall biosynthesis